MGEVGSRHSLTTPACLLGVLCRVTGRVVYHGTPSVEIGWVVPGLEQMQPTDGAINECAAAIREAMVRVVLVCVCVALVQQAFLQLTRCLVTCDWRCGPPPLQPDATEEEVMKNARQQCRKVSRGLECCVQESPPHVLTTPKMCVAHRYAHVMSRAPRSRSRCKLCGTQRHTTTCLAPQPGQCMACPSVQSRL